MFKHVDLSYIQDKIEELKELDGDFKFSEESQYYLFIMKEEIKGYAEVLKNGTIYEIIRIYISKELRYKNYGVKLIKYIERNLIKYGGEIIQTSNIKLTKFFERAGFKLKDGILVYNGIMERKKRYNENRKIIIFSILGNIILAITKITFGLSGGSRALFSDGINSLSDVATSIGMYIGIYFSNQPEDDAHPYGHEKIESVIANVLGIFMMLTAFELGRGSFEMLYQYYAKGVINEIPKLNTIGWGVFSAIVKYGMYHHKMKVGKKTSNHALIADAKDSRNDIFTSLGAVVGIVLAVYISPLFDILLSIPVAILMFKEGVSVIFENANLILDKQDENFIDEVENYIVESSPSLYVHNIRMRTSGNKFFINLHIRVPKRMTVEEAHHLTEVLEDSLCTEFENISEVLIHIEPRI